MLFPMQRLRSSRWRAYWSILVLAVLTTACASSRPARHVDADFGAPTTVSVASILGDPGPDAEAELDLLRRHTSAPALLRRAFLELHLGHTQAALEATAAVIYGPSRPSANEESFARYLRAEAYRKRGTPELGDFDRERARELALDPELRRRLPPPEQPADLAREDAVPDMTIQKRPAWRAKPPDRRDLEPMTRPNRLTIHHSAVYFRDTRASTCAAQIQKIQRDHMESSGWADIGYHFLIDPSGRIWEGRELRWQGAHAEGRNNIGNIGICLLGNFMRGRGGQDPTRAQVIAMRQLVTHLLQRYDFGPDSIHCHRDFKPTDCPGPLLQSVVTQMARTMRQNGVGRVAKANPGP